MSVICCLSQLKQSVGSGSCVSVKQVSQNTFREGVYPHRYVLTGPQSIDVLDVLYHVSHVVISAWLCFALIIHNSGDNHALRALVHLGHPCRVSLVPAEPGPGPRAAPGGVKIIPPG